MPPAAAASARGAKASDTRSTSYADSGNDNNGANEEGEGDDDVSAASKSGQRTVPHRKRTKVMNAVYMTSGLGGRAIDTRAQTRTHHAQQFAFVSITPTAAGVDVVCAAGSSPRHEKAPATSCSSRQQHKWRSSRSTIGDVVRTHRQIHRRRVDDTMPAIVNTMSTACSRSIFVRAMT